MSDAPPAAAGTLVAAADAVFDRFPARCIAFDLDDTLAPSKTRLAPEMAEAISALLGRSAVCVISGGTYEQFRTQLLDALPAPAAALAGLHLMPTCGTRYYRHDGARWVQQYAEDLDPDAKARVISAIERGVVELGLVEAHTWGPTIEDRGSQITFSALGQAAPVDAKHAWDPDGRKKAALRDLVAPQVPDLEVRSGGSTSIDVTAKGIDKGYGLRRLGEELALPLADLLFVGDRLDPGGNDYPALELGLRCVRVSGPDQTLALIGSLLTLP